jgi:hypothetical protein
LRKKETERDAIRDAWDEWRFEQLMGRRQPLKEVFKHCQSVEVCTTTEGWLGRYAMKHFNLPCCFYLLDGTHIIEVNVLRICYCNPQHILEMVGPKESWQREELKI